MFRARDHSGPHGELVFSDDATSSLKVSRMAAVDAERLHLLKWTQPGPDSSVWQFKSDTQTNQECLHH